MAIIISNGNFLKRLRNKSLGIAHNKQFYVTKNLTNPDIPLKIVKQRIEKHIVSLLHDTYKEAGKSLFMYSSRCWVTFSRWKTYGEKPNKKWIKKEKFSRLFLLI